jgi:hypothetical protein
MPYSAYYTAYIKKEACGLLVSILRSFEHLVFDRTLDKATSYFEFFVAPGEEKTFLEVMHYFEQEGIVQNLTKKQNRLMDPEELV